MLSTKWRVLFVFIVLLIAAALIANHLTGRVFNYHDPIGSVRTIYEDLKVEIEVVEEAKQTLIKPSAGSFTNKTVIQNHLPQADTTRCTDVSLGEVKYKRNGNIYTWADSHGVPHFSDTKPDFAVETLDTDFVEPLDYFELTLQAANLPPTFTEELRIKLNTVFKVYGQIIGADALKKVRLNLTVFATRSRYEQAIKQRGADPSNTDGIYFHATNSAFIYYRNEQSAMRTAIHEAVHAINQAILGTTPRWLNEGLAEYFEYTNNSMQLVSIEPHLSWISNKHIAQSVFTINWLTGLDNNWQTADDTKLYASSWAAIYFLMGSSKGKQFLKSVMLAEQNSPCSKLTAETLESMLYQHFPQLSKDYKTWLNKPFIKHRF